VVKTSVYLDEQEKTRLPALAAATGTSEAELLRRGVRLDQRDAPTAEPAGGVEPPGVLPECTDRPSGQARWP
jgi:Ribbon-helix-helix protein, copG family